MNLIKAAKQALEALQGSHSTFNRKAIDDLTTAIAEAERQRNEKAEPISWRCTHGGETYHFSFTKPNSADFDSCIPLYAHPAPVPEVDLNPATMLRLIETIKYMVGIAERGRGCKCPDNVVPEKFLLDYVVELEASAVPEGWLRAVDDAMIVRHIGIAEASDDYETAKRKLNEIIQWDIAVATDPAVNGGFVLVPVEPTDEMLKAMERQWMCGSQVDMAKREYKAMIAAAPKPGEGLS